MNVFCVQVDVGQTKRRGCRGKEKNEEDERFHGVAILTSIFHCMREGAPAQYEKHG